jgi:carbon storage regulator
MLILTRRPDEGIVIEGKITITVLAVDGDRVKVGIEAPSSVPILRSELCSAVKDENRSAAHSRGTEALRRVLRRAGDEGL